MRAGHSKSGTPRPATGEVPLNADGTNLLRREGEYWTVAYHGTVLHLRDTKGLRYLSQLLRHPAQRFPAPDLLAMSGVKGQGSGVANQPATRNQRPATRDPKSSSERARLAVTKRIKSAVRNIAAHDPMLGYHLGTTVKTGALCVYLPDPERPIVWTT